MRSGIADFELLEVRSSFTSKARNAGIDNKETHLVWQKHDGFDYVLHTDADMAFSPESVQRLLDSDKDIISAAYRRRDYPGDMVAGFWDEQRGAKFLPWDSSGIQRVDFTGCGLQLVKRHVYEKLPYPWYEFKSLVAKSKNGTEYGYEVGEDIGFAMKAKQAGIEIYVDCDNKIQHLTDWDGRGNMSGQAQNAGVTFDQFSSFLLGKVDVAKSSLDAVVNDCFKNIQQLSKVNDELAKENEMLKEELSAARAAAVVPAAQAAQVEVKG